jgi:8-oxo-dGTP pyrophosphatase MutT (NUDIX family)
MAASAVIAVPAATIMLLRTGTPAPEVLLLQRHAKSEFLPDLYVFPGGRVDPGDHELADRVAGVSAEEAAQRIETDDPAEALGFFVAAIRETFEEAGVLLARKRGQQELISGALAAELSRHRLELQSGELTLREIIEAEDLELAADGLAVHGRWITPEMVPRRFDTLFFTAVAPADHLATHDGVESTDHVWISPESALEQARGEERQMILPTLANLQTIAAFDDVGAVLEYSRSRKIVRVVPRLVGKGRDRQLVIPEDAGYSMTSELLLSSWRG